MISKEIPLITLLLQSKLLAPHTQNKIKLTVFFCFQINN